MTARTTVAIVLFACVSVECAYAQADHVLEIFAGVVPAFDSAYIDGAHLAVWTSASDVLFAKSGLGFQEWTAPVVVGSGGLQSVRWASMAVRGQEVAVAYSAGVAGNAYNIMLVQSPDAGATWGVPQQANASSVAVTRSRPSVCLSEFGVWVCWNQSATPGVDYVVVNRLMNGSWLSQDVSVAADLSPDVRPHMSVVDVPFGSPLASDILIAWRNGTGSQQASAAHALGVAAQAPVFAVTQLASGLVSDVTGSAIASASGTEFHVTFATGAPGGGAGQAVHHASATSSTIQSGWNLQQLAGGGAWQPRQMLTGAGGVPTTTVAYVSQGVVRLTQGQGGAGVVFSVPAAITNGGTASGPVLFGDEVHRYVLFHDSATLGDLRVVRSIDGGLSWLPAPAQVSRLVGAASASSVTAFGILYERYRGASNGGGGALGFAAGLVWLKGVNQLVATTVTGYHVTGVSAGPNQPTLSLPSVEPVVGTTTATVLNFDLSVTPPPLPALQTHLGIWFAGFDPGPTDLGVLDSACLGNLVWTNGDWALFAGVVAGAGSPGSFSVSIPPSDPSWFGVRFFAAACLWMTDSPCQFEPSNGIEIVVY